MGEITELARAKVNLTLRVLGRRPDGYHELDSLVAFASVSDEITLDTTQPVGVEVTGPFGPSIAGENLLVVCLQRIAEAAPQMALGKVTLNKRLPVAAGIGGGSADAAALLRAVRRANPVRAGDVEWSALALRLGADVPACFANMAQWMGGVGEKLTPLSQPLAPLDAVLVNPRVPVPPDKTARVFRAAGAPPLTANAHHTFYPDIPDRNELIALMKRCGNDLDVPATAVVPEIEDVISALEAQGGVEIVQLSGGGPTCFGIFPSQPEAAAAAAAIRRDNPAWWVEAVVLS